jgi:DNA topoisomerase I
MAKTKNKIKLLIVESPAKAKTISKYLNDEYTVRASVGHIRDLPKSSKKAIDIPGGFIPFYEISPGKEKVVAELKSLAKNASEILLATDPDREGEAIAWHIKEALGLDKPERIVFHEITEGAVQEAIKHPRMIDENLRQAQEARRVLDRIFGYDLSGLIWKKLRYGLSAGRVQSPALRMIVEREKEIRAFVPEAFWVIEALFADKQANKIPFICKMEPKTAEEADNIVAQSKKADWTISKIEEKETKRAARPPFTTSTLQQVASSRLGYSPSITMRLAQKLYEAGHITYMRTDSISLSSLAISEIGKLVKAKYGDKYVNSHNFKTKSKNAQEAHEAIRPTHVDKLKVSQSVQEQKLYDLIWARAVASQMSEAIILRTRIVTSALGTPKSKTEATKSSGVPKESQNKEIPEFITNGSRIIFDGWLKADSQSAGEDVLLPKLNEGDSLKLEEITATSKETEPPARFSEAGLVKELEKRGIGRPSTYASIIQTIISRGYVVKEQRALMPTETGEVVSDFLSQYFAGYISDEFTAEMENELDEIAEGKRTYLKTLKDFYGPFKKEVEAKKDIPKISDLGQAPADIKCPICDGPMIIKLARSGKFYSCAKFPDCLGARKIDGTEMEPPKATGELCPDCKDGKLMEREGRFGKFVACSNYPKCKYIKKDAQIEGQERAGDTGVKCPVCNIGTMVEKRGRFGVFYGCSNYPKCKNIIKAKPTGELCKLCGHLMMAGTKRIPERCSDKTCSNNRPDKLTQTNAD